MILAYHGTTPENAASIRKEGFRKGTYFAYKRDDAAQFGEVILKVQLDPNGFEGPPDFQFWLRDPLPSSVIVE